VWWHDQGNIVDVSEDVDVVKEVWRERVAKDPNGRAEAQAKGSGGEAFALENPIEDMVARPGVITVTNPDGGAAGGDDKCQAWEHARYLVFNGFQCAYSANGAKGVAHVGANKYVVMVDAS